MCGIAGILDIKRKPENHILLGMTGAMRHRGPDGEGIYIDGSAGLGHRRLSIIDLNTGAQPMSNEDGSVWITYNGEVYNFVELQNELESRGHKFRTKSDTESIIHAYEQYGEECVKKLRGMFSFCIWDAKKKTLFLARDRLGKKPLYYFYHKSRFVFASEIKAIISDRHIKRELDMSAVCDYFTYQYVPFPKTIFKNIYKLPPGHFMTVRQQPDNRTDIRIDIQQYWDIKYCPDYSVSENEWVEGLKGKLLDAVKVRLISDVPLGAFLSGGLDSSSVVAFMSRVMNQPVKTFSIGFEEADFSELEYARKIAKQYGTDHHEMIIKPDALELLPKLAWEFDEPFADSSAIPTYYVSKMARENVTVALSGDGGDETFAGYSRYASACWFYRWTKFMPYTLRQVFFGGVSSLMPYGMRGKGFLRHLTLSPFEYYRGMITQDDSKYFDDLFNKDIMSEIVRFGSKNNGILKNNDGMMEEFYNRYPNDDYLTKIQYLDTKTYLAEDILTKVDRASMLCSLETRSPLLDHEVVEFAARIPSAYKIKNSQKKYIFKKTMSEFLPSDIVNRDKMGFCTPLMHWFKKDLTGYAEDMLLGEKCRNRGFFNTKFIESLISSHRLKYRDLSSHIWQLLFFEHWCRNWLDS